MVHPNYIYPQDYFLVSICISKPFSLETMDGDRVRLIRATNNLRSLLLQQSTPEGYILLKFIKI